MISAAQRRYRDDGFTAIGPLPFRQRFKRCDALILEVLADDEHHRTRARIDRHQPAPGAAVVAELHWVGDIADPDVALRRGDDLARLYAAAALDQLAIQTCLLEVPDTIGHEVGLIDRHRHRVDRAAAHVASPGPAGCDGGAAARNDRQRRTPGDIGHYARSLSLPATFSRALSTASPISTVESFFAPGSAMSAVRAPRVGG